jgi:hypothetical protein
MRNHFRSLVMANMTSITPSVMSNSVPAKRATSMAED